MIPNITHGKGFYGLLSYLLLAKDSQEPRHAASLIGGTLTGQNVGELTAEFALIRRLRPNAEMVVMHHSLSYAPGEDPSDQQILRDTQRYLEHMGLEAFPHVIVLHRDKGCIHPHIAISKIGANREWFDARLDMPHSQIAAGLVEREFGLMEVPRPYKQKQINEAWDKLTQERPELKMARPAPYAADMSEKGIAAEIKRRMNAIPPGLALPEWVQAAEWEGLQLQPNIGGDKISGWNVQLRGTDTSHLKLSKTGIIWSKLLEKGKVHYDPTLHHEFALKLKEIPFAKPTSSAEAPVPERPEQGYPRDPISLDWDWQATAQRPFGSEDFVVRKMESSPRARTRRPGNRTPKISQVRRVEKDAPARPRLGPHWSPKSDLASPVSAPLGGVQLLDGIGGCPDPIGPREHVALRIPKCRSRTRVEPSHDLTAARPGSSTRLHNHRSEAPGSASVGYVQRVPLGGLSTSSGPGRAGGSGSSSIGKRLDRRNLAHVVPEVVLKAMAPYREMLDRIMKGEMPLVEPGAISRPPEKVKLPVAETVAVVTTPEEEPTYSRVSAHRSPEKGPNLPKEDDDDGDDGIPTPRGGSKHLSIPKPTQVHHRKPK